MGKHQAAPDALRSRIVGEGEEAPDQLLANPLNWRRHPKAQQDALEGMLRTIGWVQRVIVNRRTQHIVDGHLRVEVALRRREPRIPVLYVDLSEDEEKVVLAAIDPIGGLAETDQAMLDELLDGVTTGDEQLDAFLESLRTQDEELPAGGLILDDEVPEAGDDPISRPGDVWIMGAHRLLCGDATDVGAWDRLRIEKPAAVFTSPPYGVGGNAKLRDKYERGAPQRASLYGGHDDNPDEWLDLMRGWSDAAISAVDCIVCNVQALANNKRNLLKWMHEYGEHLVDLAVWDKGHGAPQMQRNVLANVFEFLVILSAENNASRALPLADFHGTEGNVVRVGRSSGEFAEVHRATMPVELAEWAITKAVPKARMIVDPFGGTGTTLIAAQKHGRVARIMELDPVYCDVIVRRWQQFTGKAATLESDGRTFAEVEQSAAAAEA